MFGGSFYCATCITPPNDLNVRLAEFQKESLVTLLKQRDALRAACESALKTMRHMDPCVEERWKSEYELIKQALALCDDQTDK